MSEPVDPFTHVARYVAWLLAALIGVSLALHPLSERTPAAAPSAAVAESPTPEPDMTDFDTLLAMLVERARDGIQRHGDFGVIAVALMPNGALTVAEDMSNDETVAPNVDVRLLRERIERGDARAYGWAETVHAPGEKKPDGVFFEIGFDRGHVKRREMHFGRTTAGALEFYAAVPVSTRPGVAFIDPPGPLESPLPSAAPSAAPASPSPRYPPGVPRIDASTTPQSTENR